MANVGERFGLLPQPNFQIDGPDGNLVVSRVSIFSMKRNTMRLPIDRARLFRYTMESENVEKVFPDLDTEQREFLISGATPQEWNEMFPKEKDDEDEYVD